MFDYRSLHAEAEFTGLSVKKDQLFSSADTFDFEKVIDHLNVAADLVSLYGTSDDAIGQAFKGDARAYASAWAK